jgi:two-component system, NtrC family, sensor kinase
MRRPDKAGGKAVKPRRHMTLKRRNAAKVGRKPPTIDAAERIAQLEHRLNEALEQQSATSEVLRVIASSPTEIQPVLDAIVTTAGRLLDVADAYIMRVEGQLLRAVARHGSSPQFAIWGIGATRPINRGWVTGRAVADRKTVHVRDLQAAQSEFPEGAAYAKQYGHRTTLATPLLREGNPIGAFLIRRNYVEPFTNKQIELLQNFAAQAVIAIENVRLLSELHESLQHQTATSEILASISGAMTDTKPVFDAIVRNLLRLFGTCFATVQLLHDGIVEMPAAGGEAGIEKIMGLYPRPLDDTTAGGQAMLSRQVVQFSPVVGNPLAPQGAQQIASKFDYNSIIAAPMIRQDKVIGAIICAHRGQRVFNEKEVALIKAFADQAVIAIENVRLFDEVQGRTRELAASLDDLRTTQDRLVQTQKLALLGQLTAGIAHEIKNPLNFVNNFSGISAELIGELQDTLKGMPLDDKVRTEINELTDTLKSNFDKVVHHGRRADAIVKNMLQHSREGSGEHRVIDINALVEESLNLAWHGARAETQGFEVKLKQSFDPSAGGADVFPQDIRRALLNLIANGFYAATRRRAETNGGDYEPTLTASTKNLGDRVEVRIHDNGTGMTPDVKEKMFNPFFTTKPTGEGTGLGLSISHDIIVKQHAGAIDVDTHLGEFTEIRIILPRTAVFL